jgi:hypothetical protein
MSHKTYRIENNCLNCGTEVIGKFCHHCGQENVEVHENFFHIATHTIADFFHFDSKFFRSIKPLFFAPGFLTLRYWEGKRSYYIHPLRLFFFITIVMVIVTNAYYHKFEQQIQNERIVRSTPSDPSSEEEVKRSQQVEKQLRSAIDKTFDYLAIYLKYISFVLLPLYALVFKILYRKRKLFYVDHIVYTMHLQSFVYVVISLLLLIPLFITPVAREWWDDVAIIATLLYLVISLRHVYKQGWIKTIAKALIAGFYILFTTVFFIGFIMIIIFIIDK